MSVLPDALFASYQQWVSQCDGGLCHPALLYSDPVSREDDYEELFFAGTLLIPFLDNRTVVPLGGVIDPENPGDPGSTSASVLKCRGDGPSPVLAWLKDGEEVDDTDPRITFTNVVTSTTQTVVDLRITDFRQSDAGVYQCIFRNGNDDDA